MLKVEIKKCLCSKLFIGSIIISLFFVCMSGFDRLTQYYAYVENIVQQNKLSKGNIQEDPTVVFTLYNSWIGGELFSLGHNLFYTLLPLIAVSAVGWIFSEEMHSGYLHMIIPRCGRNKYFICKLESAFIIGGLSTVIP